MMSPVKELYRLGHRKIARYVKLLENLLGDQVIAQIDAMKAEITALKRVEFLEKTTLELDRELKTIREEYATLKAQKKLVEDRWHKLMERRELQASRNPIEPTLASPREYPGSADEKYF